MKFKNDIEVQAGLKDNANGLGSEGEVLSSTGSGVEWLAQSAISASSNFTYYSVKNSSGLAISKGKAVMAVGTDGNSGHILIDELIADGTVPSRYFLGVLETTLNNGEIGRVVAFGELDQFNTLGQNGETWIDGQVLWCDPVNAGDFTKTEPDGPNLKIPAAFIMNAATNGKIQVRVQTNEGVKDLYDTSINGQIDGDVLAWNNTTGVWFNDSTLNVDYTNSRIGIGTTSPNTTLEVDGAISTTTSDYVQGTTGSRLLLETPGSGNTHSYIQAQNSGGTSSVEDLALQPYGGNVGIGTASPTSSYSKALQIHASGNGSTLRLTDSVSGSGVGSGLELLQYGAASYIINRESGPMYFLTSSTTQMTILANGNVGIGTTAPNYKLQVGGEIDASGGNGYRINGKPWANESSNLLRLGNWNSEGFSTSVFDENSIETLRVVDEGVIISSNYSKFTAYGSPASLLVGGSKFSPYGEGVLTLLNNEPNSTAGMKTGSVQFAIKDDVSSGYVSSSITGSINSPAGSGGSGGGILDFLTSSGGSGSSPTTRMRISSSGNVGIGTTSPSQKLHVNGNGYFQNGSLRIGTTSNVIFNYITSLVIVAASGQTIALGGGPGNVNNNVYIGNGDLFVPNGNVGIGTASPGAKLEVFGNASIGAYHTNYANAQYNVNLGFQNYNNGFAAIATGQNTLADADVSFSMGYKTRARGVASFAGGNEALGALGSVQTEAIGTASLAFGSGVTTSSNAFNSQAFGRETVTGGGTQNAYQAMAIGYQSRAWADNSFAGGNNSDAFGQQSFAFGAGATASAGDSNIALGLGVTTNNNGTSAAAGQVVVGKWNDYTSGVGHSFAVGTGSSASSRYTAFCVRDIGYVGIGVNAPNYQLQLSINSAAKPSSNVWTVISDERVKENIKPYEKGLNEILQVNTKTFDYNGKAGFEKTKGNIGIIAQEMMHIFPETINSYSAKLNEDDEEETELYNFDGHALTFALINAVKELKAEIEELKKQINK